MTDKARSRTWNRWIFWCVVAVALLVLFGGYRWAVTPHVNPQPTRKVVVKGIFPYDRGWELRIQMGFHTQSPICKVMERAFFFFPVAETSREHRIWIPVTREGENRYSFIYYEDYLLPGLCEWSDRFTSYRIYQGDRYLQGGAILGLNRLYNQINYSCELVERPRTKESGLACYEGNNHSSDPRRIDNEVNFIWREGK